MQGTFGKVPADEMKAMLERFKAAGEKAADRAAAIGGEALASEAQVEAPVRTGLLQGMHFMERIGRRVVIGVDTSYALAVHERHPTKKHWFISAVKENFTRIMGGALKMALREEAEKVRRAGQ